MKDCLCRVILGKYRTEERAVLGDGEQINEWLVANCISWSGIGYVETRSLAWVLCFVRGVGGIAFGDSVLL